MNDQAQGLRDLVDKFDFDEKEVAALRSDRDSLDYRRLWVDLKAELANESEGKITGWDGIRNCPKWTPNAESFRFLERMEQAETFARFKGVTHD